MKEFVQRWWIFFAAIGIGVLVAWSAGRVIPPPIFALFVIAFTLILVGILRWREKVWMRQARLDLIELLADYPVYLTSDLWDAAVHAGILDPADMAAIRRRQNERAAARRAEEEQA